jgi:hypothetical protein
LYFARSTAACAPFTSAPDGRRDARVHHILLRDQTGQAAPPGHILLPFLKLQVGRIELRLRLSERDLEPLPVDLEQHRTFLDEFIVGQRHGDDRAGHLGRDDDGLGEDPPVPRPGRQDINVPDLDHDEDRYRNDGQRYQEAKQAENDRHKIPVRRLGR